MRNALVLTGVVILFMLATQGCGFLPGGAVILHAAPGKNTVPMFSTLRSAPPMVVTEFPDGTRCTKARRKPYQIGGFMGVGDAHYFFKLNCAGTVGFVNDLWVEDE